MVSTNGIERVTCLLKISSIRPVCPSQDRLLIVEERTETNGSDGPKKSHL